MDRPPVARDATPLCAVYPAGRRTLENVVSGFDVSSKSPRRGRPESTEQPSGPPNIMKMLRPQLHQRLSKEEEMSILGLEDLKLDCQRHLAQEELLLPQLPLLPHQRRPQLQQRKLRKKDCEQH